MESHNDSLSWWAPVTTVSASTGPHDCKDQQETLSNKTTCKKQIASNFKRICFIRVRFQSQVGGMKIHVEHGTASQHVDPAIKRLASTDLRQTSRKLGSIDSKEYSRIEAWANWNNVIRPMLVRMSIRRWSDTSKVSWIIVFLRFPDCWATRQLTYIKLMASKWSDATP